MDSLEPSFGKGSTWKSTLGWGSVLESISEHFLGLRFLGQLDISLELGVFNTLLYTQQNSVNQNFFKQYVVIY